MKCKRMFKFNTKIFVCVLWLSFVIQMGTFNTFASIIDQYDDSKEADMNYVDIYDETALLSSCSVGGYLTIWGDITTESELNINENVVIDLNGYKVSANARIVISSGKELVIKDSKYNENNDEICGKLLVKDGIVANDAAITIVNGIITSQGKQRDGQWSNRLAGGIGIGGSNAIIKIYDGIINSIGGTGGDGGTDYYYGDGYAGGIGGIGIGGNLSQIYIYGGNIVAIGGAGGNGGNAGVFSSPSHIPNGGNGGYGGAGIECINGVINIYDGALIARGNIGGNGGKRYSADGSKDGISCSKGGAGITTNNSIINIQGGVIKAYGAEGSAAIGGSITDDHIDAGKIKVTGGYIYVDGGEGAYDIGSATGGNGGEIEVLGGEIEFCSDGRATNCISPVFKNCSIYGVGAHQHEGIYNSDGKINIELKDISVVNENLHINDIVEISVTFKVNKKTGLSLAVPKGKVAFYIDGVEVGRTSLIEIESDDEFVSAKASCEWSSIEGSHIVNAKYIPGTNDKYSYLENNITKMISVSDHSGSGTCISEGICEICGELYGGNKNKYHVGESHLENVTDSTCTSNGYTGDLICNTCGEIISNGISNPTVDHEYLEKWESDSLSHWHNCKNSQCDSVNDIGIHEFGVWSGTVPTCKNVGISTRTCSVCGYKEQKEIPINTDNHTNSEKIENVKVSGYTGGLYCKDCKTIILNYDNGEINTDYTGMLLHNGKWIYVNKGKYDTSYTGMAQNSYGLWYMKSGKLDRTYTGMILYNGKWIYVNKGKYDISYTGMAQNSYGLWYMKDGKLDRTYTGMNLYGGKWIYVKEGKYDTTYTGMAKNSAGVWYMKNGVLDRTYTGMYIYDGKWIYVNKGKYDIGYTGMAYNSAGWWYINKGNLDRTYTGLAKNSYGTWYMQKGKLNRTFSGKITINGYVYIIKNGKVV